LNTDLLLQLYTSTGLDEYITSGVQEHNLMMGVPWHGYDYTCETFRVSITLSHTHKTEVSTLVVIICYYILTITVVVMSDNIFIMYIQFNV